MPHPRAVFPVDEQLLWLVELPEVLAGAARAASPASLACLGAQLDALGAAADSSGGDLAGVVTAALMLWLRELPELPFIGEPFGGAEGTD